MDNHNPIKELELYIIRHGQSMGNAGYEKNDNELTEKEKHDPILTEKGVFQAQKAGSYLREIPFDAVISSAMLRAVQTATEILKYQKNTNVLNVLPLACEMITAPDYKGVTMEEIRSINENAVLADGIEPDSPMIYSNDKDDEAATYERAKQVLNYLRAHYHSGEKVALVSHAAFITYIVFTLMGFSKQAPCFDVDFNNTGITKVVLYKPGTNKYGDTVFEFINDTAHLKENGIL